MDLTKVVSYLINTGITERKLASLACVRQSTINRIRNGKTVNPSLNTTLKIVDIYKNQVKWGEK